MLPVFLVLVQGLHHRGGAPPPHRSSVSSLAEQWRAALDLLSLAGPAADVFCFNAALGACAAAGRHREALRLLEVTMPRAGIAADAYSYSAIFNALGRAGKGRQVLDVLQRMRRRRLPPSLVCYAAATSALQRCGRWFDALEVFETIEAEGLEPDIVAYGAALAAARAGGDVERCLSLAERMAARGLALNAHCVNELRQACAQNEGAAACSERAAALMQRSGDTELSQADFNVLLDSVSHGTEAGNRLFLDALSAGAYRKLADPKQRWTLDLHGLSGGAARHAVEWWLTDVQSPLLRMLSAQPDARARKLTIITGSGRGRKHWQRSAVAPSTSVRSSVQSFLEEAHAPLRPTSNEGVLELSLRGDWGAFAQWVGELERYRAAEFTSSAHAPPELQLLPSAVDTVPQEGRELVRAAHLLPSTVPSEGSELVWAPAE